MVSWVLGNGFNVCSRQTSLHPAHESWTCQRSMDGARVQLDHILADGHVTVQQVWHDYIIPIGLDHRCVHCILQWSRKRPPPKTGHPKLDANGTATSFCNCVMEQLTRIQEVSCQSLEKCLVQAGKLHGTYGSKKLVSDLQRICYACGGAHGRLPTWSKGSSCRFRSGNFIVKNHGHGDPHLCVCV